MVGTTLQILHQAHVLAIADRSIIILTVELLMLQALTIGSHKDSARIRSHSPIRRMEYFSSPIGHTVGVPIVIGERHEDGILPVDDEPSFCPFQRAAHPSLPHQHRPCRLAGKFFSCSFQFPVSESSVPSIHMPHF